MNIVSDWREGWKWLSIHAATITAILGGLQATFALLPPDKFGWLVVACGIATIWARLIAQGGR